MKAQSDSMIGAALVIVFLAGWAVIGMKLIVWCWSIYGDQAIYLAGLLLAVAGVVLVLAARVAGVR